MHFPDRLAPLEKADQIFPWFIAQEMPAGLAGLVIAGVFAAAMSSLDSSIHSIATAITTDFVRRFRPKKSEHELLNVARVLTIVLGLLGTGTAMLMVGVDIKYLWDVFLGIVGLLGGTLCGLFMLGSFTNHDIECVMETVGADGQIIDHFDGRMLNPGHAIEGAWFIINEGKRRGDQGLIETGCQMLDWMWQRGWDPQEGGILYFTEVRGLPVQEYWHDMKFWWPQNEAIIATLLAYQMTGNEKYADWHRQVHDWAHERFQDPEHGEWFGYLHRDGRVSVLLKGNMWKGPFHIPRMQLVCWQILAEMSTS